MIGIRAWLWKEKKLKYLTGIILGIGYHKLLIKWLKEEAKYIVGKKWP